MAKTAPRTILLKGDGQFKEGVANAAITPGYLIERMSTGNLRAHATAAKTAAPMFAIENELLGKGIDTDYASNDQVYWVHAYPGAEINALVAASAAAIVIGDKLESAGDGTLRKAATDAATDDTQRRSLVAIALEAVDNSGGGAEARIKVEVL